MRHGYIWGFCSVLFGVVLATSAQATEYLVKLKSLDSADSAIFLADGTTEVVSEEGRLIKWTVSDETDGSAVADNEAVEYIQKNHPIRLLLNPSLERNRAAMIERLAGEEFPFPIGGVGGQPAADNPEIQSPPAQTTGADPLLSNAWGLGNVGASHGWNNSPQGEGIIVAVTDTGIDYNHEDLIANMWRNPGEIAGDGIDNDGNGFVDDIVGWDFATDDNKPYDLTVPVFQLLFGGGNPGHGTHCAGVVGARMGNGKGAAGVAPKASLMALRFINENGQGDTAAAVKVVDYAVKMGAKIISASWGSEGEEAGDQALREAVLRAQDAGVLFVAAAGNGRVDMTSGGAKGFDNDNDPKPMYPSSYPYDNVIAVSAIDSADQLAGFSNWGRQSVDLGAPGVKVLSTVPGNQYQDTVIDLGEFLKATWDGTSMATPHVSGALANLWSADPSRSWTEIKAELLAHTRPVAALAGKVSTGGKLDLSFLSH